MSISHAAPDVEVTDTDHEGKAIMAQYAILIYAQDTASEPGEAVAHANHAQELADSGAMVLACALAPREMATSLRGDTVTDGPFLDTKEVIAGFCVIEAPDLDAALAIASRNPAVRGGGSGVEVRPVAGLMPRR